MIDIQVSLIVWTVICFLLLMLILDRLLFRPMLRCMDARESRVATARERHRQNGQLRAAAEEAAERAALAAREQAERDAEGMITEAQAQAASHIAVCREEEHRASRQYAAALAAERESLCAETEAAVEALSEAFAAGFFR